MRNGDYAPGRGPGGAPAQRPEFAYRGGGGRNDDYYTLSPGGGFYGPSEDDYTPSPGGSNYSPSEDDFIPSPSIGRGQKRFDQWPTTKGSNPSGPPTRPGSSLRTAGNRKGPSPLGPGVSTPPPASLQGIET
ncbi:hypothetical protein GJ744_009863 [Endocarpon pusillum]|uniref:Uncharacterized protein n=1 Tax=Endocarpon pusillum TaxID=364733 RepID=A0A8H7AJ34_9EURO|nr:hypothetical protein GJ744_009863 [Endocarpon pusillum]